MFFKHASRIPVHDCKRREFNLELVQKRPPARGLWIHNKRSIQMASVEADGTIALLIVLSQCPVAACNHCSSADEASPRRAQLQPQQPSNSAVPVRKSSYARAGQQRDQQSARLSGHGSPQHGEQPLERVPPKRHSQRASGRPLLGGGGGRRARIRRQTPHARDRRALSWSYSRGGNP